jgi:hypothetical protein
MMIELRIDKSGPVCNGHADILNSINMVQALKAAGVPIQGILIAKGIERGRMTWHNEDDIDGEVWVIGWTDEPAAQQRGKPTARGDGRGYTWARWGHLPATVEDDEL